METKQKTVGETTQTEVSSVITTKHEEAMENAEEHDEDLIIGEFYKNSEWRSN